MNQSLSSINKSITVFNVFESIPSPSPFPLFFKGTSMESNPNAMATITSNTVFTNVAETPDGGFWWEGLEKDIPVEGKTLIDWTGKPWTKATSNNKPAAHPNSRFCAPIEQCPVKDPQWEDPEGVPISAIIFGGRRPQGWLVAPIFPYLIDWLIVWYSGVALDWLIDWLNGTVVLHSIDWLIDWFFHLLGVPLVYEALNWDHGVFMGSAMRSEATAAAEYSGKAIMHDPFAMRPFFGYNFGKYLDHWLSFGKQPQNKLPRIFHVNWFRKDAAGKFIWPGFGENCRVLDWIVRRVEEEDCAVKSAVGESRRRQKTLVQYEILRINQTSLNVIFTLNQ